MEAIAALLMVLTLASIGVQAFDLNNCPAHLARDGSLQIFGDHCFRFVLDKARPYHDSRRECITSHGRLAMPKSNEIQEFLVEQLNNTYNSTDKVWIGLHDENKEMEYRWVDGSKLEKTDFTAWAKDEPLRNSMASCVYINMYRDGRWRDAACNLPMSSNPYICQYEMTDVPSTCKEPVCNKTCNNVYVIDPHTGCTLCLCRA